MKLLILSTVLFIGNAMAKDLPPVQAPRELTETSSEFAEGTITRLSAADVDIFIPYAQNAQSVLNKALEDIRSMTVQQQVKHLTAVIKAVVRNSGQKNYQTFMRFSLNRTLFLVQELVKETDWATSGTVENVLNIQVKGIELALRFYESDLAYQRRANQGKETVALNHAAFANDFGRTMLTATQNVLDASAQYRLLYKILEMINWDFSRDQYAIELSDTIVEIYTTLYSMDENPTANDADSVQNIRRLNTLIASVEKTSGVLNEIARKNGEELSERQRELEREAIRQRLPLKQGQAIFNVTNQNSPLLGVIHEIRKDTVVLKYSDNTYGTVAITQLGYTTGCVKDICVGDKLFNMPANNQDHNSMKVVGITADDKFVLQYLDGEYTNEIYSGWTAQVLSKTTGCSGQLCVNDTVFNMKNKFQAKIVGIQPDGNYILQYLDGEYTGERGGGWTAEYLTKIK
ncbi:hypothetical protein [Peredibacter starrii]|uniref:Uncharacterized protein n=1 Tax=Peredibacter starrii TaxID=28202 RepID=A0AAX4HPT2_9BACT|nr:hypothetical protein [Peredibacter starrii]WPU65225.1 hypothetical protein SOO65_00495 [Peredibacter starrii]